MKMKEQFLESQNSDGTVTIYDLDENCFYNLNSTASIIFENIHLAFEDMVFLISETFKVEKAEIYLDVKESLEQIKVVFFD